MKLPTILIVDDIFGSSIDDRKNLCLSYRIKDITGDDLSPEVITEPISEAIFCSGQSNDNVFVKNDIDLIHNKIEEGWSEQNRKWSLILLDLRFVSGEISDGVAQGQDDDDVFGLKVLRSIKDKFPELPVIIISSRDRAEVIEDCRRSGAVDFIQRHAPRIDDKKPYELLDDKLKQYALLQDETSEIVGCSLPLLKMLSSARRSATGSGNILILGESGTGKESLARYIHDHSPVSKGPYEVFHAFGTAETLQEDLLFGHVKGAFTGAIDDKKGLFEIADKGTLFIDEIGDITSAMQNRLLRPIESREVQRQGDSTLNNVDVQIVLATNKSLDSDVESGKFKFDLLNRIQAYTITIPSLRERKEDIPLLTTHLLEKLCKENNAFWPRKIHADAMSALIAHHWKDGNVRELRNILEHAVKDNKDAEILVVNDLQINSNKSNIHVIKTTNDDLNTDDSNLSEMFEKINVPEDYANLRGVWPVMQKSIVKLFVVSLNNAIQATRKQRLDGPSDGEINITGAVSCLFGRQLTTIKAADFIKRMLKLDGEPDEELLNTYPDVKQLYEFSIKKRLNKSRLQKVKLEK